MGEGERLLRSFGASDDYPHLLRLLEDGEKFVNVDLADLRQEPEAKATSDHSGIRQRALFILVEPLQAAADDQANVIRNIDFIDPDVFAELAGGIEDFPLFDQMQVDLLDEEWITLAIFTDETQNIIP